MKKFLTAAMAVVTALSLGACASSAAKSGGTESAKDTAAESAKGASSESAGEAKAEGSYAGKTLIMATNAEFPPYEYHEGKDIVGIDVEIAKAVAEQMGAKFEVSDMAFDAIISAVDSGKADFGAAGMTVTEDRKKNVDFSDTYATSVQSVIIPENSDIKSIDDLKGKKIGVQQGTTGDIYATKDYGKDAIQPFPKGVDAVLALGAGKVDAVIIDGNTAKAFVADQKGLKLLDSAYAEEEYAICVKKGNTELRDGINAALKELKASGKLDEIVAKYIKAD